MKPRRVVCRACSSTPRGQPALQGAANYTERCALLVEKHCDALKDFTGERAEPIALDVGCAVGGATFELTKAGFREVMGIDYSRAFVRAAETMAQHGSMSYQTVSRVASRCACPSSLHERVS